MSGGLLSLYDACKAAPCRLAIKPNLIPLRHLLPRRMQSDWCSQTYLHMPSPQLHAIWHKPIGCVDPCAGWEGVLQAFGP